MPRQSALVENFNGQTGGNHDERSQDDRKRCCHNLHVRENGNAMLFLAHQLLGLRKLSRRSGTLALRVDDALEISEQTEI